MKNNEILRATKAVCTFNEMSKMNTMMEMLQRNKYDNDLYSSPKNLESILSPSPDGSSQSHEGQVRVRVRVRV